MFEWIEMKIVVDVFKGAYENEPKTYWVSPDTILKTSHVMKKGYIRHEQQRPRFITCTSAQSDQCLHYLFMEALDTIIYKHVHAERYNLTGEQQRTRSDCISMQSGLGLCCSPKSDCEQQRFRPDCTCAVWSGSLLFTFRFLWTYIASI